MEVAVYYGVDKTNQQPNQGDEMKVRMSEQKFPCDTVYSYPETLGDMAPKIERVKCSCGHVVPRGSVMSASMGSTCPDCYDRMSE
jgi:hypothetical protein